ncbi:hypothetical protein HPB50_020333 [Hyalomma asiaticum]|uniref:Uncharacterized protein n=1 Tax=Hyalomma asiaticum TaxID=266040 RepID=A0ACB7TJ90_HYAAI|nr:hypothetical protein HPB50_020333 [Hyalomma asiaticum]
MLASFPRLTPPTLEESSRAASKGRRKNSQKSASPNSQEGWVDECSREPAVVKVLKEQNRRMQKEIKTMGAQYNIKEQNRTLREQTTLLNKPAGEGSQKSKKEVS